jgi:hypothetical protein
MELRKHPSMSYHGVSNWPPSWVWRSGPVIKRIRGEVGVLKDVTPSVIQPADRLYLVIEHEHGVYAGMLIFGDAVFCRKIFDLLKSFRGYSIEHIGGLELEHLL